MEMTRREFAGALIGVAGAAALGRDVTSSQGTDPCHLPPPIQALTPKTSGITPITDEERRARIAKAQRLMAEQGIGAVVIEPGSSMGYYTAVRWRPSERTFALVMPASGAPAWVCPAFEEARARELIRFGDDIRVWQEDESPSPRSQRSSRSAAPGAGRSGSRRRCGSSLRTACAGRRRRWSWSPPRR